MKKVIFKYLLFSVQRGSSFTPDGKIRIKIPKGEYKILSINMQDDQAVLWLEVDPPEEKEISQELEIIFRVTGEPYDPGHETYIGSGIFLSGSFVLHFFLNHIVEKNENPGS